MAGHEAIPLNVQRYMFGEPGSFVEHRVLISPRWSVVVGFLPVPARSSLRAIPVPSTDAAPWKMRLGVRNPVSLSPEENYERGRVSRCLSLKRKLFSGLFTKTCQFNQLIFLPIRHPYRPMPTLPPHPPTPTASSRQQLDAHGWERRELGIEGSLGSPQERSRFGVRKSTGAYHK